jgi:hypothetical protein
MMILGESNKAIQLGVLRVVTGIELAKKKIEGVIHLGIGLQTVNRFKKVVDEPSRSMTRWNFFVWRSSNLLVVQATENCF